MLTVYTRRVAFARWFACSDEEALVSPISRVTLGEQSDPGARKIATVLSCVTVRESGTNHEEKGLIPVVDFRATFQGISAKNM
jgi:hypothetical protein